MASIEDLKKKLGGKKLEGSQTDRDTEKLDPFLSDTKESESVKEFEAKNLEGALEKASKDLGVDPKDLDYEVLGSVKQGLFSKGIRIQVSLSKDSESLPKKKKEAESPNGSIKVVVRRSGVFLTVYPPNSASGKKAGIHDAQLFLMGRGISQYDNDKVRKEIENPSGKPVKVADWSPNSDYDSRAALEISSDTMKVNVTVTSPILSGRVLEKDEIVDLLRSHDVQFGILEKNIENLLEQEDYNRAVLVAEGMPPEKGRDAQIDYRFNKEGKISLKEDEQGRVDYKELDLVQNVVEGQVLAIKTPAQDGKPGRRVNNELIEAQKGHDVPFLAGLNATLSEDGLEVVSNISGRVTFLDHAIGVDPVYEVKRNVGIGTGNIVFLGAVLVRGNIEDGFSVKASGNVEVHGNIGAAFVESDNDVIVRQGIMARNEGFIKASGNVFAKFIENGKVSARNDVIVKEEILHSQVDAGSRVICHGKKGVIAGGRIRAGYEVNAKNLGSSAYTDTLVEVGIDPQWKDKLFNLEKDRENSQEQFRQISNNISTLQRHQKAGQISEEKKTMLKRLELALKELKLQVYEIEEDTASLTHYLENLSIQGKVSAKANVFPGAKIWIRKVNLEVKNDFQAVTFIEDKDLIRSIPYQAFKGSENRVSV